MSWLDTTPEGRACVEAGAEALHTLECPCGEGPDPAERYTARIVLAAALDVRVPCDECEGRGSYDIGPESQRASCLVCGGAGTVPVLYPRGEKP